MLVLLILAARQCVQTEKVTVHLGFLIFYSRTLIPMCFMVKTLPEEDETRGNSGGGLQRV